MEFMVSGEAKWRTCVWDKTFELLKDFKNEYNLNIKSISSSTHTQNKYCFSIDIYDIWIEFKDEETSEKALITFKANTTKEDFDDKFNFIFKRLE